MSSKTNLTDFDPELLGEYSDLHIKNIVTVNDGDTLAIIDSNDVVKEMGDLLPVPAKNLTDIEVNEDGDLIFTMDNGESSFNAGMFNVVEDVEENFPPGAGVLTDSGILKQFVDTDIFKVEESDDKFTVSIKPNENAVEIDYVNFENVNNKTLLEATTEIETYTATRFIKIEGSNYLFKEKVKLLKGDNKFTLTLTSSDSVTVDVLFKRSGTDTLFKNFPISVGVSAISGGSPIVRFFKVPEDMEVDITFRYSSEKGTALYIDYDETYAFKKIQVATMLIEKIDIDVSDVPQFVEPQEFVKIKEDIEAVDAYYEIAPVEFEAEQVLTGVTKWAYREMFHHGDKVFFMWHNGDDIHVLDTVTGETENIPVDEANYIPGNMFKKGNLIYIIEYNKGKVRTFNLDTYEIKYTDYTRAGGPGFWNYAENTPSYFYSSASNNTYPYYYSLNPETGAIVARSKNDIINNALNREALLYSDTSFGMSFNQFPVLYTVGNYEFVERWCTMGKLSDGFNSNFLYENDTEIGVIKTLLPAPRHSGKYNDDFNLHGGFTFEGNGSGYNSPACDIFTRETYVITTSAYTPDDVYWWRTSTSDNRDMVIKGFDYKNTISEASARSRNTVKEMGIYVSDKPTLLSSGFSINRGEGVAAKVGNYAEENVLGDCEPLDNRDTFAVFIAMSPVAIKLNADILVESISIASVNTNGSQYYRAPDDFHIETSSDGVSWETQEFVKEFGTATGHPARTNFIETEVLGLRITPSDKIKTFTVSGIAPIEVIEGDSKKRDIFPVKSFEDTVEGEAIEMTDGSIWSSSAINSPTTGIHTMFSNRGRLYLATNLEDPDSVHVKIMYPQKRTLSGIYISAYDDFIVEYTLDGSTWEQLTTTKGSSESRYTYTSALGNCTLEKSGNVPDDGIYRTLTLKDKVLCSHIRFTTVSRVAKTMFISRLRVNKPKFSDYRLIDTFTSSRTTLDEGPVTRHLFDEPVVCKSMMLSVLSTYAPNIKSIHIGQYTLLSDESVKFTGTIFNKETFESREYLKEMSVSEEGINILSSYMVEGWRGNFYSFFVDDSDNLKAILDYRNRGLKVVEGNFEQVSQLPMAAVISQNTRLIVGDTVYTGGSEQDIIVSKMNGYYFQYKFKRKNLLSPWGNLSTATVTTVTEDELNPGNFLINLGSSDLIYANPVENTIQPINRPVSENSLVWQAFAYLEPIYDHVRKIYVLAPRYDERLVAIHEIGVEAKRRKRINPIDGSVGYMALPDSLDYPDSFVQMYFNRLQDLKSPFYVSKPLNRTVYNSQQYGENYGFARRYISQPELILKFAKPFTLNAFDIFSEKYISNERLTPTDLKIYSSLDGVNWTLLLDLDLKAMGYNNAAIWYERQNVPRTTVKYLKLTSMTSQYATSIDFGAVVPLIDEEMFITDEYNRSTIYGDEILEENFPNGAFASSNAKFNSVSKASDTKYILRGPISAIYDIETGLLSELSDVDAKPDILVIKSFQGTDGRTILLDNNGFLFYQLENGLLEKIDIELPYDLYRVTPLLYGNYFFTGHSKTDAFIINFVTGELKKFTISANHIPKNTGPVTYVSGDDVYAIPMKSINPSSEILKFDISGGPRVETLNAINVSNRYGFNFSRILSNGDILLITRITNSVPVANNYILKAKDYVLPEGYEEVIKRINKMGS